MTKVYLGLGANLGDCLATLQYAIGDLQDSLGDLKVSPLYESEPMYLTEQPRFLNAVVAGTYQGSPQDLLALCRQLEEKYGRNRLSVPAKGPRNIDLDILLFGSLCVDLPELQIPHPGLTERAFVLRPLMDLEPELLDPRTSKPIRDSIEIDLDEGIYRRPEILV